jgi:hypothetical protein
MQEQALQAKAQEDQMKLQFEAAENEKERQKDLLVAEIRAAGYGAQSDINQNLVSDYKEAIQDVKQTTQYQEQMNFKREQAAINNTMAQRKMDVERDKLATQRQVADTNLEIARENKNKYDVQSKKDDKKG